MYINDEFFPAGGTAVKTSKPPKKQPPVTVVYEDDNFAVLYKPAHLLCHSDRTGDPNLVDAFAAYLESKGEYDPAPKSGLRRRSATASTAAPRAGAGS